MNSSTLRSSLKGRAEQYAENNGLPIDTSHKTASIFKELGDNFFPASFEAIQNNPNWKKRLEKQHQKVSWAKEVQSSNSSDALLMSTFCYPKVASWKGIQDLLGVNEISPYFAWKPKVRKAETDGDETEIDMAVGDLLVEAKLTEDDFESKAIEEVEKYIDLKDRFHTDALSKRNGSYDNYQVIRNLLASIQHGKRHMLFCDERRPDLVREYLKTVSCLREVANRSRCQVVFWQEIARACGRDLAEFLEKRYGIC